MAVSGLSQRPSVVDGSARHRTVERVAVQLRARLGTLSINTTRHHHQQRTLDLGAGAGRQTP